MAEDKFFYSDFIVDDGTIKEMIKQFQAAQKVFEQGFKDIRQEAEKTEKEIRNVGSVGDPKNAAQIQLLVDKVKELERTLQQLNEQRKRNNTTRQKFIEKTQEEQREIVRTSEATRQRRQELRQEIREEQSAIGSKNRLKNTVSRLTKEVDRLTIGTDEYNRKVKELRRAQNDLNNEMEKAGRSNGFVGRYQKALSGLNRVLGAVGISFAGITAAQSAFATAKEVSRINNALKSITDSSEELNRIQDFLTVSAENYGLELNSLSLSYVKFAAATRGTNLQGEQTLKIFDSVSKSAANMGLSIDETNGVLNALGQIVSKSTVQAEELRGQLGDRLSGAFRIFADSIGISTQELDKLLKQGGVLADETLPKFAAGLEKAYGVENLRRVETLVAEQNRLGNAWTRFITSIEEGSGTISKVFGAISQGIGGLLNGLTDASEASRALQETLGVKGIAAAIETGVIDSLQKAQQEFNETRKEINSIVDTDERVKALSVEISQLEEIIGQLDLTTKQGGVEYKFYRSQIDLLTKSLEASTAAGIKEEEQIKAIAAAQAQANKENERAAKLNEIRSKQAQADPATNNPLAIDEEAAERSVERTNKLGEELFEKNRIRRQKERDEQIKEQIAFTNEIVNAFLNGAQRRLDVRQEFLARSLLIEEQVQAEQLKIIQQGGEANLNATKENQRKLEEERLIALKRQERIAKLQILLNLLAAFTQNGQNVSTANSNAQAALGQIQGVSATFGEGGIGHEVFKEQNPVSTRGSRSNRTGYLTRGIFGGDTHKSKSGGILARVEANEGIFNTKAMSNLGRENFHALHDHLTNGNSFNEFIAEQARIMPVITQIDTRRELKELKGEMEGVKKAIQDKPVQMLSEGLVNGIWSVINEKKRGNKSTVNVYSERRYGYGR